MLRFTTLLGNIQKNGERDRLLDRSQRRRIILYAYDAYLRRSFYKHLSADHLAILICKGDLREQNLRILRLVSQRDLLADDKALLANLRR